MENSERRFDDDILQCKAEILRLKRLVPPFGRPPKNRQEKTEDRPQKTEDAGQRAEDRANSPSPEPAGISAPEPAGDSAIKSASGNEPLSQDETPPEVIAAVKISPETPAVSAAQKPDEALQEPVGDASTQPIENAMAEIPAEEITEEPQAEETKFEKDDDGDDMVDQKDEEAQPESIGILAKLEEESGAAKDEPEPEPDPEPEDELEIPGFDLAQQIMAEQRKTARSRRKGPGSQQLDLKEEKPRPTNDLHPPRIKFAASTAAAPMSPQLKVIAEIVARDIRKYYQADKLCK